MATLEQTVEIAADRLIKAVDAYGPKATELVLETGRIAAAQSIVYSIVSLIIGVVLLVVGTRLAVRWFKTFKEIEKEKGDRYHNDEEFKYVIGTAISSFAVVAGSITTFCGVVSMFNLWMWVGLWRPELYLAVKLLKL